MDGPFARGLLLWQKSKGELLEEMDSVVQMPGWGNIWTQPIINRIDMLATGVRTPIGVKVFGDDLEKIKRVSEEVAAVLRQVPGAVGVTPDQNMGKGYVEIVPDRRRAARYGINVGDIQDVIEVALGGKPITMTVEGRERFPVRIRYARHWREDEEQVKNLLVSGAARGVQVPLSMVADVRIVEGPSMINSENGMLRSYVQLNVRDRDLVGFVEDAQRAVAQKVKLPQGMFLEWSGQFEHQLHAKKTLLVVLPLVLLLIFVILYLTYNDLMDAVLMMMAVPEALVGGVFFLWLLAPGWAGTISASPCRSGSSPASAWPPRRALSCWFISARPSSAAAAWKRSPRWRNSARRSSTAPSTACGPSCSPRAWPSSPWPPCSLPAASATKCSTGWPPPCWAAC